MADEPVRSLLAELGFDFDPTGADRFKEKFDDLRVTLKKGQKEFSEVDFDVFFKNMQKNFKKGSADASRYVVDLTRVAGKIKDVLGASFTTFSNIEEAYSSIKFKTDQESVDKIKKSIDDLPDSVKNLTKEIDLLNIVFDSLEDSGKSGLPFILKNLELISGAALLNRKTLSGSFEAINDFIVNGNIGGLQKLDILKPEQVEQLKQQKFEQTSSQTLQEQRREFFQSNFAGDILERTRAGLPAFSISGAGVSKRLDVAKENFQIGVGKNVISPVLNDLVSLTEKGGGEANARQALENMRRSRENAAPSLLEKASNAFNIVFNIESNDPAKVAREVDKKLKETYKRTLENQSNKNAPQAQNEIQ